MLFLHLTTHVETDADQELLGEKGGGGFPYLVVMDAEGRVLSKPKSRNVSGFEAAVEAAGEAVALRKKAEGGDKEAALEVFMSDLDLNNISSADATRQMEKLEMSEEQKTKATGLIANKEVQEVLNEVFKPLQKMSGRPDEKTMKEYQVKAGARMMEMKKAGRIPPGDDAAANFWSLILAYAEEQKDVETFEEGLGKLREKFGNNPGAAKFFADKDEVLKKMKEAK